MGRAAPSTRLLRLCAGSWGGWKMDGAQISALMAIKDDPVKCVLLKADGSEEEVRIGERWLANCARFEMVACVVCVRSRWWT